EVPFFYEKTDGYLSDNQTAKSSYYMDDRLAPDLDALLGTQANPKSRDQICQSLSIVDAQTVAGSLNWQAVLPVFVANARRAYTAAKPMLPRYLDTAALWNDAGALSQGADEVANAIMGTIKLLLCAPPSGGYWPSTFAAGFAHAAPANGPPGVDTGRSYNSAGGSNHVIRTDKGNYLVMFDNLAAEVGGNLQVSADDPSLTPARCHIASGWQRFDPSSPILQANVLCTDLAGNPIDSEVDVSYVRQPGPDAAASGAYLWADQPLASAYVPRLDYQWNASGARNLVSRLGVG